MDLHILQNMLIIFMITVGVIILCNFLKIPFLIGYLIAGIILSPNTTSLLEEAHEVEAYAEIGVILLLFTVGLEFSFSNLKKLKKYVLIGGALQVVFTITITALLIFLMGRSLEESVFWGFVTCLSSTAIVIKILQDTMQLSKEHGKILLSILLFQDIVLVPLMLFTPILAGVGENPLLELGYLLLKLVIMAVLALVLGKYAIPRFLRLIVTIQSQDVFLIATIFIVVGIALISSYLGLSLSLGAFLAGLIIAETDYNRLAVSCFLPFRYVFITFFFISMGMLLDYRIFIEEPWLVLFWFMFIMVVKIVSGILASFVVHRHKKTAFIVGISIAQIGEFSFVLAKVGLDLKLIAEVNYQVFLAISILSMALAPILVNNGERIANYLVKRTFVAKLLPAK